MRASRRSVSDMTAYKNGRHKRDRKSHSSDFLHNAGKVGNETDRDSG